MHAHEGVDHHVVKQRTNTPGQLKIPPTQIYPWGSDLVFALSAPENIFGHCSAMANAGAAKRLYRGRNIRNIAGSTRIALLRNIRETAERSIRTAGVRRS
jgi:hypothetical protein